MDYFPAAKSEIGRTRKLTSLFISSRCPVFYHSDEGGEYGTAGAASNDVRDDPRSRQVSGLRGCNHRRHQQRYDLAQNSAAHEPAYDVSYRAEIEIRRCLARTQTTEYTGSEINQNLFHN
jgi:hypothetical protein